MAAETTLLDLQLHFNQFSDTTEVEPLRPGSAVVCYATAAEAATAVKAYNGSELLGATIKTEVYTGEKGCKGGDKGWGKKGGDGWGGKGKGGFDMDFGGKGKYDCYGGKDFGGKGWGGKDFGYGGKDFGGKGWGGKDFGGKDCGGWGKGCGKFGKGGGWQDNSYSKVTAEPPTGVYWIGVDDNSALVKQGMGNAAPVLVYDKTCDVFKHSQGILAAIVGEMKDVNVVYDGDWEHFPEVGAAVQGETGEEQAFSVAIHPPSGKWAVGCAPGWKTQKTTAELALAVALGVAHPGSIPQFSHSCPEFVALCQSASGGAKKRRRSGGVTYTAKPKAPPMQWITLKSEFTESKILALGLAPEGPIVVHEGKEAKAYFSDASNILSELVPNMAGSVKFSDDPDWELFPEVAAAMKANGMEESCIQVAICEEHGCWAAGVGAGKKAREPAAKLALCVAVAVGAGRVEEMSEKYPEFKALAQSAGLSGKKAKVA